MLTCFRKRARHSVGFATLLLAALAPVVATSAEPAPSTRPSTPLLDQLDRESRQLYQHLQQSMVRVEMPTPRWLRELAAEQNLLQKWRDLDPQVRRLLEEQGFSLAQSDQRPSTSVPPRSTPTTLPSLERPSSENWVIIIPPAPTDAVHGLLSGRLPTESSVGAAGFNPNYVGLTLDEQGHVLVPLYVEKELVAGRPIPIAGFDGKVIAATYVGSDRATNLTILRAPVDTRRAVLAADRSIGDRPAAGSLLMYLAFHNGAGRLGVWSGQSQDAGIAFETTGRWVGLMRAGHFFTASACKVIAEQLVAHGEITRAKIGVRVIEVGHEDPQLRRQLAGQGRVSGMKIESVLPGSAAEESGLRPRDVIFSIANMPVDDVPDLAVELAIQRGPTPITYLRDGEVHTCSVDLRIR